MAASILLNKASDIKVFDLLKGTNQAAHVVLVDSNGSPIYAIPVAGDVAHDAADSGNPVKVGGKAHTSAPSAVANGDRVNAYFDDTGHQHVKVDGSLPAGTAIVGSVGGLGIMVAATAVVSAAATTDADALVAAATGLRLIGFSIVETAGAAATLKIIHGATGAGGTELVGVNLAASESTSDWFGPEGIAAASGLSIDRITGTTRVVLYYKTVA